MKIRDVIKPERGGRVERALRKGVDAVKSNPLLASLGASYALSSLINYNRNQRKLFRLFAKDYQERQEYQEIINTLMRTGKYHKVKEKYVDGGYYWELKRR